MKNYIIIFTTTLFSLAYSQTGLFVDSNKSAFGVWGDFSKPADCSGFCPKTKTLSFNYLAPFSLEFSISQNTISYSSFSYSYSYNSWGLGYYFDINNGDKLNLGYQYSDIYDEGFESDEAGELYLIAKSNDGLVINLSFTTLESKYCESSYYTWPDDNYYCESYYSYSNSYETLSIGKYFEVDSYVFGIEYSNFADENFFDIDYGLISLSIGSVFKR
tara:strand:- start:268 stop:918 length:651 start_codon:yes stop_codon:yes gene_type:complete